MSEKIFLKQKEQCLSAVDLSRKGSIDEPIAQLVHFINYQQHYFTTSSCSGRVCLFEDDPSSEIRKKGCLWLYTTHGLAEIKPLTEAVKKSIGCAYFKFEPFVLHVQCCTLDDAQMFHEVAVASGFRNSGLSISKKGKIVSAVRSTHSLDVPITEHGKLLVSEEYLEHLVKLANNKTTENLSRINRFYTALREKLTQMESLPQPSCKKSPQSQVSNKGLSATKTTLEAREFCDENYDDFSESIDLFTDNS